MDELVGQLSHSQLLVDADGEAQATVQLSVCWHGCARVYLCESLSVSDYTKFSALRVERCVIGDDEMCVETSTEIVTLTSTH
jgi:hypothetical protein